MRGGQVSEPDQVQAGRRARTWSVPSRPAPVPRPVIVDACAALAGLGFGAVLAAVILGESRGSLAAPGGLFSAAGLLAAFAGTYLMLIMVVLIARLPWLESSVGQDRLVRWHRQLAPWAIGLITAHAVSITLGYAQASSTGALRELWVLVTSYRDMLAAAVGFGLLITAGISSYRHVRRRLQVRDVVGHSPVPVSRARAGVRAPDLHRRVLHRPPAGAGAVDRGLGGHRGDGPVFRVAQPAWRACSTSSGLSRSARRRPGSFGGLPGAAPPPAGGVRRPVLPLALPHQGDVVAGAPVLAVRPAEAAVHPGHDQGARRSEPGGGRPAPGHPGGHRRPPGTFTDHARPREGVALFAAGVGITPVRALLEDLPAGVDVVVVVRASTPAELVFRKEVATLVRQRRGRLQEIVGSRHEVRLNARVLRSLVPDIGAPRRLHLRARRVQRGDRRRRAAPWGTDAEQIHTETFGF